MMLYTYRNVAGQILHERVIDTSRCIHQGRVVSHRLGMVLYYALYTN